jgi:hypothetical protein
LVFFAGVAGSGAMMLSAPSAGAASPTFDGSDGNTTLSDAVAGADAVTAAISPAAAERADAA